MGARPWFEISQDVDLGLGMYSLDDECWAKRYGIDERGKQVWRDVRKDDAHALLRDAARDWLAKEHGIVIQYLNRRWTAIYDWGGNEYVTHGDDHACCTSDECIRLTIDAVGESNAE